MNVKALENIAWAPYDTIPEPTREDWQKSYDALRELAENNPKDGRYPNTLGYLCYYGRHTGERDYAEARQWFEKGADLKMIESTYKLADMLMNGLGGEKDPDRAVSFYSFLYSYCRAQFEGGNDDSKFPDLALRIGRLFHEGTVLEKDDMEALSFLLEAKYALDRRKRFREYGDRTVAKNISDMIEACEKPDEEMQSSRFFGLHLGRVPRWFLNPEHNMVFTIQAADDGDIRLEFRRKRKNGKKPDKVLWSTPPAMKCFLTDFVVLYGTGVREIWNRDPGQPVVCDRYEYDEEKDAYLFYLKKELQCRLQGGDYLLSMDEFFFTGARDAEGGTGLQ